MLEIKYHSFRRNVAVKILTTTLKRVLPVILEFEKFISQTKNYFYAHASSTVNFLNFQTFLPGVMTFYLLTNVNFLDFHSIT